MKTPLVIMKYHPIDGGFYFLTNNSHWVEKASIGYKCNQLRFWTSSGNAWNAISRFHKAKLENFNDLFVVNPKTLELTPFTLNNAFHFANILNLTTDAGELDAIAKEAFDQKSKQIELLKETLTELRVASIYQNSED